MATGKADINEIIERRGLSTRSMKDIIADTEVKNALLTIFSEVGESVQDKSRTFYGDVRARAEVPDIIVNYPKAVIEPRSAFDVNKFRTAVQEVGQLRLPFPKMLFIDGIAEPHIEVGVSDTTKVRAIVFFFAVQNHESIDCYIVTNRYGVVDALAFRSFINPLDNNKIMVESRVENEQAERLGGEEKISGFAQVILHSLCKAIYMMTLNGGEFYLSIPTEEEKSVNAKRIRKGKRPFIEFKLITIDGKKKDAVVTTPHGTHASPRQHWRRGHWRTAPKSGKKVWIDPMLVGDEANGKIIKDYAVGVVQKENHVHH